MSYAASPDRGLQEVVWVAQERPVDGRSHPAGTALGGTPPSGSPCRWGTPLLFPFPEDSLLGRFGPFSGFPGDVAQAPLAAESFEAAPASGAWEDRRRAAGAPASTHTKA